MQDWTVASAQAQTEQQLPRMRAAGDWSLQAVRGAAAAVSNTSAVVSRTAQEQLAKRRLTKDGGGSMVAPRVSEGGWRWGGARAA